MRWGGAVLSGAVLALGAMTAGTGIGRPASACSRIAVDRDSISSYMATADAVVVGTFGDQNGDVISLHVEEGLKGVRTGQTLSVVNQHIDDCPSPRVYDTGHPFAKGIHVLALLKHEGLGTGAEWRVSPSPGGVAAYDGVRYFVAPDTQGLPSLTELKARITTMETGINPALETAPPCDGGPGLLADPLTLNGLSYLVAVGTFGQAMGDRIDFAPDDVWRGKLVPGRHVEVDNRNYDSVGAGCERVASGTGRFAAGERALLFLTPDRDDPSAWEIAGWHTQAYWVAGDQLSVAPMPTIEELRADAAVASEDDQDGAGIAAVGIASAVLAAVVLYGVSRTRVRRGRGATASAKRRGR